MKLCIICEDENVELARENAKNVFPAKKAEFNLPSFMNSQNLPKTHLSIALSADGNLPATHWFCFLTCDESTYQRIIDNKIYSHVEQSSPKEFLEKWNLKIIK